MTWHLQHKTWKFTQMHDHLSHSVSSPYSNEKRLLVALFRMRSLSFIYNGSRSLSCFQPSIWGISPSIARIPLSYCYIYHHSSSTYAVHTHCSSRMMFSTCQKRNLFIYFFFFLFCFFVCFFPFIREFKKTWAIEAVWLDLVSNHFWQLAKKKIQIAIKTLICRSQPCSTDDLL